MSASHANAAFEGDDGTTSIENMLEAGSFGHTSNAAETITSNTKPEKKRETWAKSIEFLLSCIAMSVGLGNVWRFPFTALDNGGGAFLIPYLIVLFLIGTPIYYLEMVIGQFSSRGTVKVFDLCPAMRGIGIGQVISIAAVTTYYLALMSLTLRYLYESFKSPLPWAECHADWQAACVPSSIHNNTTGKLFELISDTENFSSISSLQTIKPTSSAELYFIKEVLHEKADINDGIGLPNWELVIGLFVSWLCVFLIIMRGVRSSGKASYFLALFPYLALGVLLIRAVTLPGSMDGIIYFIKPDWSKILEPKVWYAAVTQCFYSLSIFGNLVMYSSFNKFDHNVRPDAIIITVMDTFTSLLAGFTIFGIIGHLAHVLGTDDIGSVVQADSGLAFISYPDAIAKFKHLPQIFSVVFFLMLFSLGIGSAVAMTSCTVTAIREIFPRIRQWPCALGVAVVSFLIGLTYVTPGGQFILTIVDYFGSSMLLIVLGIAELYVLGWIYGVDRLCKDIEFMMGHKVGLYWRLCWSVITPVSMTVILVYFLISYTPVTYNGVSYPTWASVLGWNIAITGIMQVPVMMCLTIIRQPGHTLVQKIRGAFQPKQNWGPSESLLREQYYSKLKELSEPSKAGLWRKIKTNIFG